MGSSRRIRELSRLVLVAGLATPCPGQLRPVPEFEPPAAGPEAPWHRGHPGPDTRLFGRVTMPLDIERHAPGFIGDSHHGDISDAPATVRHHGTHRLSSGRHNYRLPPDDPCHEATRAHLRHRGFPPEDLRGLTAARTDLDVFCFPPERPWALAGVFGRPPAYGPGRDPGYRFPRPSWYVVYARRRQPPPPKSRDLER